MIKKRQNVSRRTEEQTPEPRSERESTFSRPHGVINPRFARSLW